MRSNSQGSGSSVLDGLGFLGSGPEGSNTLGFLGL